jgi:asparagine synthase (glutamine-hydrolysing)
MGGFIILRKGALPDTAAAIARAEASARRMGFSNPTAFDHGNYSFRIYPKIDTSPPETSYRQFENGDFAFSCGALIYAGRTGGEAVDKLVRAMGNSMTLPDNCYGHFVLVVCRGGRVTVLGDGFGGYHIYYDMLRRVVSSSFLMLAAVLPSVSLSTQNIYEYVFNGVVSGNETPLREIVRLPIGARLELGADDFTLCHTPPILPMEYDDRPVEEHLGQVDTLLQRYFEAIGAAFGDNVVSALSGGYDSRLLLALARRQGIRPRLYVYGPRDDPDVVLAQQIAAGESLSLDVIDKGSDMGPLSAFAQTVEWNYWSNDGHVWAGLLNNGAEAAERRRRVANGALNINGGGGEILRNFFYLRDASYSPRQLLWTFYSQFDPAICTDAFLPESYYRRLEEKLAELVGDVEYLSRPTVSWLYHRFRCRSWDCKFNSESNRFGYAALPFQERRLAEISARIPLTHRNHGRFEAALIRRIDPRLAGYPSVYGHSFGRPPSLQRKVHDFATILRPTWLRRLSFRLQHRLGMTGNGLTLDAPHLAAVLPGPLDFVDRFFRLDRARNPDQINRILSLEYLARHLGANLDPAVD